jgi:TatD DNase family protein
VELFDAHSHFDVDAFDADRDGAYTRALEAGVAEQVLPAISAQAWPRLRQVAATYPGVHATYGLHPMYLAEHRPEHLDELAQWLERERPVAVGECGLDFFVEGLDPEAQAHYFTAQLDLARELGLPVIIHARRAVDEVTKQLRHRPGLRGMVHSFSGSEQQARTLIDLGFYLSFGGPVTYPRANRLRRLVATLPLEAMLIETDSPDQPDSSHRGERNEPAFLPTVLQELSRLREADPAEIAAVTTANARRLFGLRDRPAP